MKVHTYHTPIAPLADPDLLAIWASSWAASGWDPCVVYGAPDFSPTLRDYATQHSSNPPEYQLATFAKWWAASQVREPFVLMVDWDVLNCGFEFTDLPIAAHPSYWEQGVEPMFVFGDNGGTLLNTGALYGRPSQFRDVFEWFGRIAAEGIPFGACHDEDILRHVLKRCPVPIMRVDGCPTAAQARTWNNSLAGMVHFTNGTTPYPRSQAVRGGLGHEFRVRGL